MGLFGFLKKKKKDEVPLPPGKAPPKKAELPELEEKKELPEIPSITEIEGTISVPKEGEEAFELPELPEMKAQPGMEEIKEAIEEEKEPTHLEFPEKPPTPSAEERLPLMAELPPLEEVPEKLPEIEEVPEVKPVEIEGKIGPIEPSPARPRLKEIKEPVTREKGGPIFVETNEFTNLMKDIEIMKSDLKKADSTLSNLNDLKNKQDSGFEKLRSSMENIERKLIYVDNIIFEKG